MWASSIATGILGKKVWSKVEGALVVLVGIGSMLLWLLDAMYVEMASVEELVPTYVREKHQTSIVPASSFRPCWTVGFFVRSAPLLSQSLAFRPPYLSQALAFLFLVLLPSPFEAPPASQALFRFLLSSLANLAGSNPIRYNYQHKVLVARSCVPCCLDRPSERICNYCGVPWLRF